MYRIALTILGLAACGPSTQSPDAGLSGEFGPDAGPSGEFEPDAGLSGEFGSVRGKPFVLRDAVITESAYQLGPRGPYVPTAIIVLSDSPGLCDALRDETSAPDTAQIAIALTRGTASTPAEAPVPGEYRVGRPASDTAGIENWASAAYREMGTDCLRSATDARGTLAMTTLSTVAGETSEGRLALLVGFELLEGSFTATSCDASFEPRALPACP